MCTPTHSHTLTNQRLPLMHASALMKFYVQFNNISVKSKTLCHFVHKMTHVMVPACHFNSDVYSYSFAKVSVLGSE